MLLLLEIQEMIPVDPEDSETPGHLEELGQL